MLSILLAITLLLTSHFTTVVGQSSPEPASLPANFPIQTIKGPIVFEQNTTDTNVTLSSRQEFPANFFYCGDFNCERCLVVQLMNPQVNRCMNVGGFRSVFVQQASGEGFPFKFLVMMEGCLGYLILPDTVNVCFNLEVPDIDQFTNWGLAENVPGIDI
jgi:hypothetical protein